MAHSGAVILNVLFIVVNITPITSVNRPKSLIQTLKLNLLNRNSVTHRVTFLSEAIFRLRAWRLSVTAKIIGRHVSPANGVAVI